MTYMVGDTVYADFSRYGRTDVRKGTVLSVSKTGVARVDFGRGLPHSFKSNGWERGAGIHNRAFLIDQQLYERQLAGMRRQQRERAVSDAIKALAAMPCRTDNKPALLTALATVTAAIGAL